jgi:hypothetical protein
MMQHERATLVLMEAYDLIPLVMITGLATSHGLRVLENGAETIRTSGGGNSRCLMETAE